MGIRFWKRSNNGNPVLESAVGTATLGKVLTHRAFLKGVAAAVGGALLGPLVTTSQKAEATYIPSTPSDTVDTNLTVQGNLIVNQSTAIGTSTTQGKLHVAGDIWVNGVQAIGTDGVVKESYYAQ